MSRISIALVLLSLAGGLGAPALCSSGADSPMPCCKGSRDCGASLGRPSCCVDPPADHGRTATGVTDTPARLMTATASILPAPVVANATLDAASRYETHAASADPPPLFLLHTSLIC